MDIKISGSIVLFHNDRDELLGAIQSFIGEKNAGTLFLIDNSKSDSLSDIIIHPNVKYIFNNSNIGFGAAHNIAFQEAKLMNYSYHVIINPDITFELGTLEILLQPFLKDDKIGLVMPKVLNEDGSTQKVAKLIPTPLYYFARRFIPFNSIKSKICGHFELNGYNYDFPLEAPFLSGCFMLFDMAMLTAINGFDQNIFLYFEDNDICRKVLKIKKKTLVYPIASVTHHHVHKSFFSFKNLFIYFKSGIYYFNKWGWFFDKDRAVINQTVRMKIVELNSNKF